MIPIPISPQWPSKANYDPPEVRGLPLVNPNDPKWKQIRDWLINRPRFIVVKDYFTWSPMLQAWIFIPKNFVYDFASIPRFPFGLFLRPSGILVYGAGPHDFGSLFGGLILSAGPGFPYKFVELSNQTIDDVFKDLNDKSSNLGFITSAAHWAVSNFGDPKTYDIYHEIVDWTKPVGRREIEWEI